MIDFDTDELMLLIRLTIMEKLNRGGTGMDDKKIYSHSITSELGKLDKTSAHAIHIIN